MPYSPLLHVVVDTDVVFTGLTSRDSYLGLVIEAWLANLFVPCVSNTLISEYITVLSRKLSSDRWQEAKPVLNRLIDSAYHTPIYYSWRPSSPDPGDDFLVDCAMNAGAAIVTSNFKDFKAAQLSLGLTVLNPVELINKII